MKIVSESSMMAFHLGEIATGGKMNRIWISVLATVIAQILLIIALYAGAIAKDPAMKIVEKKGEPARIVTTDGRVAVLKYDGGKFEHTEIPFKLAESNCSQVPAHEVQCTYHFHFWSTRLQLIWESHLNPELVGKPVGIYRSGKNPDGSRDFDLIAPQHYLFSSFTKFLNPIEFTNGGPDWFECNRYDWLPARDSLDQSFTVKSWTSELMIANSETRISENRSLFTLFDSQWKPRESGFEIVNLKAAGGFVAAPPVFGHNVMILTDKDGTECQVDWSGDETNLRTQSTDTTPISENAPDYFHIMKLPSIFSQIGQFLSPSDYYTVENLR